MDKTQLLLKLMHNVDKKELTIIQMYNDTISNRYIDEKEGFITCINDLKKLSSLQYDFKWLSESSKQLELNRRHFRELCDIVCVLLGDKLKEFCIKPLLVEPTRFEDYCPLLSEDLVIYSIKPINSEIFISDDKDTYKLLSQSIEETPYYTLYCYNLDKL